MKAACPNNFLMSLKINNRRLSYFTFLFWLSLLVAPGLSCTKEPTLEAIAPATPAAPITPVASSRLLSSTLIGEYTPSTLAGRVPDLPIVSALTQYSIRVYKLTYTTPNTDG